MHTLAASVVAGIFLGLGLGLESNVGGLALGLYGTVAGAVVGGAAALVRIATKRREPPP